jgi:DNA mismatch repair protein MutH
MNEAPKDLNSLLTNARNLQDKTLAQAAQLLGLSVPDNLHHMKGFIGHLFELLLGADAGCESRPDFTHLGVELKTLPVDAQLRPLESTYVCTVPLQNLRGLYWEQSVPKKKLAHVLWVPVLTEAGVPIAERKILPPFLWKPDSEQEAALKTDFEELIELIATGQLASITASIGSVLHIRPKAAHGKVLTSGIDAEGELSDTLPRGFYLRQNFTRELLLSEKSG